MKKISLLIVYLVSFIYMEFLYKILLFDNIFKLSIINMLVFIIIVSLFMYLISKLFNERVNKIIYIVSMILISIWFSANFVIKDYFDFYLSLSTFKVADQVVGGFLSKAVIETLKRIIPIILFFLPLIMGIIFNKYISYKQFNITKNIGIFFVMLLVFGMYLISLNIGKNKVYSAYELYYHVNDVALNMENLGVFNTFYLDIKRTIFGFEEKLVIDSNLNNEQSDNKDNVIVYEYNNLEIDFESLLSSESNSSIKKIHEYMLNDSGTLQNEYTGMFEGKNLILFMAESFNEIAVSEELTPTLYKLVNNGFVFKNFYTPTIYSTIGGEFQELTGLYAESLDVLKDFRSGNIYFPQGIGNVFNNLNYNTYAYHNNSYTFQDRNKYLKSMGFNNFLACNNGIEKLIDCNIWPRSDVEMIEKTYIDYIDKDNFMVFYATVSGHSGYSWSANAMARKHKEEYLNAGLNYSEGPASYIASQMELDRALELLIQKLDEKGILEDTVIALVGDHYPYELTIDEVNEVSSYEKDSVVLVNKSNFILWNSSMENVVVEKVGSQLDVIPTIYNLFGIDYDSRLFVGKDILSTEGGLAIFGNRSWVSDKGIYYSHKNEFVAYNGVEVEEEYVKKINQIVNSKISISKLIIENNYYKKVIN